MQNQVILFNSKMNWAHRDDSFRYHNQYFQHKNENAEEKHSISQNCMKMFLLNRNLLSGPPWTASFFTSTTEFCESTLNCCHGIIIFWVIKFVAKKLDSIFKFWKLGIMIYSNVKKSSAQKIIWVVMCVHSHLIAAIWDILLDDFVISKRSFQ